MNDLTPPQRHYAEEFAEQVLGYPLCPGDIREEDRRTIFRALSRKEETETGLRDSWGNWDWPYGDAQRAGLCYVPWLDRLVLSRRREQVPTAASPSLPWWPGDRPFALCLSHDVDTLESHRFLRRNVNRVLHLLRSRPTPSEMVGVLAGLLAKAATNRPAPTSPRTYADLLALEEEFGFRSTFFFGASQLARRHRYDFWYSFADTFRSGHRVMTAGELIREIAQKGWEVGIHGSYASATIPGLLTSERQQLEDLLGQPVTSVRQHYLRYDAASTPRLQAQSGIKADSTQGFNRSIGFRAGTSFPYWCWDHEKQAPLPVVEVPMHAMEAALFRNDALEYDMDMAIRHMIELMDRVAEVHGCLTINWHLDSICVDKVWGVYRAVLQEAARRNAWGCAARDVTDWWINRAHRLASSRQPKQDGSIRLNPASA